MKLIEEMEGYDDMALPEEEQEEWVHVLGFIFKFFEIFSCSSNVDLSCSRSYIESDLYILKYQKKSWPYLCLYQI